MYVAYIKLKLPTKKGAFNGFLLVHECYSTDYLLVSDNISPAKLFVSQEKQIVSQGKQPVLTCHVMLKSLSRRAKQPESRGDLGKNR